MTEPARRKRINLDIRLKPVLLTLVCFCIYLWGYLRLLGYFYFELERPVSPCVQTLFVFMALLPLWPLGYWRRHKFVEWAGVFILVLLFFFVLCILQELFGSPAPKSIFYGIWPGCFYNALAASIVTFVLMPLVAKTPFFLYRFAMKIRRRRRDKQ